MSNTTLLDTIAERIEREFDRLKAARPALFSRISRAENILVTHLSCSKAGIIRPRLRGGELVAYLVKGSGGAVYRVEPETFSCSCPDYHRRGKGCKHSIACWALWRASTRSAFTHGGGRRCAAEPKITRHEVADYLLRDEAAGDFEHVGDIAPRVLEEIASEATTFEKTGFSYEERTCSRCLDGLTYDGQAGEWVACERCSGTGRVLAFLYKHAERHLSECVGCGRRYPHRELIEVTEDHESLAWFVGDKLCRGEAGCGRLQRRSLILVACVYGEGTTAAPSFKRVFFSCPDVGTIYREENR